MVFWILKKIIGGTEYPSEGAHPVSTQKVLTLEKATRTHEY